MAQPAQPAAAELLSARARDQELDDKQGDIYCCRLDDLLRRGRLQRADVVFKRKRRVSERPLRARGAKKGNAEVAAQGEEGKKSLIKPVALLIGRKPRPSPKAAVAAAARLEA